MLQVSVNYTEQVRSSLTPAMENCAGQASLPVAGEDAYARVSLHPGPNIVYSAICTSVVDHDDLVVIRSLS